jgi:PAS domain S-box-containing protein
MDRQTWKILMVDDDEDDFILTSHMLSEAKWGKYLLDWADSYEDGWKKLESNHYDAVLMDYDLGAHNGLELIKIAADNNYPFPVILFTGRGSYEVDLQAMQAGAALYLTKSEVNPLLLERGIRYAIERKRTQMMLVQNEEALRRANQDLIQELHKREQAEQELKVKSQKLQVTLERQRVLSDAGAALLAGADPLERLDDFFQCFAQSLGLEVYVQYNVSQDGKYLELGKLGGLPQKYHQLLTRLDFGQAVCGTVAQTRQPMYVNNVHKSKDRKVRLIKKLGIGTYACHPLMVEGKLLGTLSFGSRTLDQFDPETVSLLKTFCNMVANAINRKQVEEVLRRERELLHKLFDRIPVMITMYHPDLQMVQFNPKFEELIGWTTEDTRQGDFDLLEKFYPDPEYRSMVVDFMRSLQDGWRDFEVTAKDGTIVESSWTNIRLLDDTQIGIGIDIRERKQAEAARHISEEKYRHLFNNIDDSIVLFEALLDASRNPVDFRYVEVNPSYVNRSGVLREKILNSTLLSLFPKTSHLMIQCLKRVLVSGQPEAIEEYSIALDKWFEAFVYAPFSGHVAAIVRDITERKQMEEKLRLSEERLSKAFNATPSPMVISRMLDGKIELINDAFERLSGYCRSEVVGKTSQELRMIVNPADREEAVRRLLAGQTIRNFDIDFRLKSGEIRRACLFVQVVPVEGEDYFLTVIENPNPQRQIEAN